MITDTAFRKSSLGKLFLEKIVPDTSRNWTYYFSALQFKLHLFVSIQTITNDTKT